MRRSSVGSLAAACAVGYAMMIPAVPAQAFAPWLECANEKISEETLARLTPLSGPANGAAVLAGTPLTLSGESSYALTFSVSSLPALLSSPDIDSGPGLLQPGTHSYTFTSTKAAATPRTIYWAASFTVTLKGCEGPSTFMTPVRTLTVYSPPPTGQETAPKEHQEGSAPNGASVTIEKVKVTAGSVVITVKTSLGGKVTISGRGLAKTVKTLPPGIHRVTVSLTKAGKAERKHRKLITLAVSLRTSNQTVSSSEKIKL
jgi:hypothetical protein